MVDAAGLQKFGSTSYFKVYGEYEPNCHQLPTLPGQSMGKQHAISATWGDPGEWGRQKGRHINLALNDESVTFPAFCYDNPHNASHPHLHAHVTSREEVEPREHLGERRCENITERTPFGGKSGTQHPDIGSLGTWHNHEHIIYACWQLFCYWRPYSNILLPPSLNQDTNQFNFPNINTTLDSLYGGAMEQ